MLHAAKYLQDAPDVRRVQLCQTFLSRAITYGDLVESARDLEGARVV